jgi:hypothetical protein
MGNFVLTRPIDEFDEFQDIKFNNDYCCTKSHHYSTNNNQYCTKTVGNDQNSTNNNQFLDQCCTKNPHRQTICYGCKNIQRDVDPNGFFINQSKNDNLRKQIQEFFL